MATIEWIDDDTVKRRVRRLTTAYDDDFSVEDQAILEEKTLDAYHDIAAVLIERGFTAAQILTWAQREEYQRDIAAYYFLLAVGFRRGDKESWIEEFKRLEELEDKALVTDALAKIDPEVIPDGPFRVVDIEAINEALEIELP